MGSTTGPDDQEEMLVNHSTTTQSQVKLQVVVKNTFIHVEEPPKLTKPLTTPPDFKPSVSGSTTGPDDQEEMLVNHSTTTQSQVKLQVVVKNPFIHVEEPP